MPTRLHEAVILPDRGVRRQPEGKSDLKAFTVWGSGLGLRVIPKPRTGSLDAISGKRLSELGVYPASASATRLQKKSKGSRTLNARDVGSGTETELVTSVILQLTLQSSYR